MKLFFLIQLMILHLEILAQTLTPIKIGKQTWSAQNLNVNVYQNGDAIPEARTEAEWIFAGRNGNPAWCNYLNDAKLGLKYGKLYNWYAVKDERGICPSGWHVPNDNEWLQLTSFIGGNKLAGDKLKSKDGWGKKKNRDDLFGFSALPAGYRDLFLGTFSKIGEVSKWWTSREENIGVAWMRSISSRESKMIRHFKAKENGYSVRCIKND